MVAPAPSYGPYVGYDGAYYGGAGFYHGAYYGNSGYYRYPGGSGSATGWRGSTAHWNDGSGHISGYRGGSAAWGGGSGSATGWRGGTASWGGGSGSFHGAYGRSGSWSGDGIFHAGYLVELSAACYVLSACCLGQRLPYLTEALRVVERLEQWNLVPVYAVATLVAVVKLDMLGKVEWQVGAFWLVALALCSFLTARALDVQLVEDRLERLSA